MKTINPNIPPPNGYKFLNEDGVTITGNSWPRLERNVIAYRKRINQSTDNVFGMIVQQICALAPGFCKDTARPEVNPDVKESLKAKVIAWLGKRSGEARNKRLRKVDVNTAKVRSKTCVGCPNRNAADVGCSSCQANLKKLLEIVLDGQKSAGAGLGACSITKEYLPASVHLFDPKTVCPDLPNYCWRKKT